MVDNLLFYSVLCQQFLHRAFRTDVSSAKNAYMLFRVAKVFSLPNLREMLLESGSRLCVVFVLSIFKVCMHVCTMMIYLYLDIS